MELSLDQLRIINSKTMGQSLIKGVAGSGKTTVALFKLVMMQQQKDLQNEKVLVVTYNKTLIKYMEYLCQLHGVKLNREQIEIRTIDSLIWSLTSKDTNRIVDQSKQREIMLSAMQKVRARYPNNKIILDQNVQFILEEIDWLRSCRYLERDEYMNVERLGRSSIGESKIRLLKQSENRAAIFDVFQVYEDLLKKNHLTDYKMRANNALEKIQSGEIRPTKYNYIIVDESQDLSRTQLEIIRESYADKEQSNIIFIADVAQSIYSHSWLSKQSFKSIGFDMSGKSNILSKNYRTTRQIAEAAYSLINNDNDLRNSSDYVEPELMERAGMKPRYRQFANEAAEFAYIANEIKKCALQYGLREIVVAAKTNDYLMRMKTYLLNHGVDAMLAKDMEKGNMDSFQMDKVKLFTLHAIKGLEASIVFIAGINEGVLPYSEEVQDVERKLLYVGMTRAKEVLYLTSSRNASPFIWEINSQYLQISEQEQEGFYDISIEKYQFVEQIQNSNTRQEERVRQWYLSRLQMQYNYLPQRMKVESVVRYGSKTFFVDIAVYEDDAQEVPFIYVETKKPGEDLSNALKQVKCYMVPGNAAKYIVVTDGKNEIIERYENGNYILCEELPIYQEEENYCEIFRYYDLIQRKEILYKQTKEGNISFKNMVDNSDMDYGFLPVKGIVAAGNLKFANESHEQEEIIPLEIIRDANNKFILEVSGDSMVDFNILDGDKIIVKQQSVAVDGSIVVGGNMVMNEATVKQFHYEGDDTVILHPGNKKYKDIVIKVEDFYMNGIVIGVLRKE